MPSAMASSSEADRASHEVGSSEPTKTIGILPPVQTPGENVLSVSSTAVVGEASTSRTSTPTQRPKRELRSSSLVGAMLSGKMIRRGSTSYDRDEVQQQAAGEQTLSEGARTPISGGRRTSTSTVSSMLGMRSSTSSRGSKELMGVRRRPSSESMEDDHPPQKGRELRNSAESMASSASGGSNEGGPGPSSMTPSPEGRAGKGRRRFSLVEVLTGQATKPARQARRDSVVRRAARTSIACEDEVRRATEELDDAQSRARAGAHAAAMAHAKVTRGDWETRILAFLAEGNARLPDGGADGKSAGTLLKSWLNVQDELKEAETKGVPLSENARAQMIKMNPAEKAIKSASAAAIFAAERAEREWLLSKEGKRAQQVQEVRTKSQASRAEKLAEEARILAAEAEVKQRAKEEAIDALRQAKRLESLARWGALSGIVRSSSASIPPAESEGSRIDLDGTPSQLRLFFCCCCAPKAQVMPQDSNLRAARLERESRWSTADGRLSSETTEQPAAEPLKPDVRVGTGGLCSDVGGAAHEAGSPAAYPPAVNPIHDPSTTTQGRAAAASGAPKT